MMTSRGQTRTYLKVATSSLNASRVDSSSMFSMSRNLMATSPCQLPAWTVLNLPLPILSDILSSSKGMSHSRMDIPLMEDQVLPPSPSTLVVESWLSMCPYVLTVPMLSELPDKVLSLSLDRTVSTAGF